MNFDYQLYLHDKIYLPSIQFWFKNNAQGQFTIFLYTTHFNKNLCFEKPTHHLSNFDHQGQFELKI